MLSENIKLLRQAKGLSQVELSKELGVTKQCVSNWENDNVIPSVEMLVKLADYFKVTTDYLLGRTQTVTVDVSGLTKNQISHISHIISDFEEMNAK